MGAEISWAETRLKVLRHFNLAGSGNDSANKWGRFIRLSQQAGFSEIDFRGRISASRRMVEQWARNSGCPPEDKREQYRHVIVGVLTERLQPKPSFQEP